MEHNWKPTLTYQRFRRKHYELNRLYWTQYLGIRALSQSLQEVPEDNLAISEIAPDINPRMHMLSVGETRQWSDEYLSRSRLHLLVICSANLESYLKEITFWHLFTTGYGEEKQFRLTSVGKAMGSPIIDRASLPEPLKYSQSLFGIDLDKDLRIWQRSYKLRCAAAHNGGIVSARTIRDIPDLNMEINDRIGLDWDIFKNSLESAERIAKSIDKCASTKILRIAEVNRELEELHSLNKLPDKDKLWSFVHSSYGLKGLSRKEKISLEEQFYP